MPANIYANINDLASTLSPPDFFEQRIENDVDGNPLYVAWSPIPGAATDEPIWFIKKIYYDGGGFTNRVQIPDNGGGYIYAWDDRATYFT